jgi:DNA-binding phage protein
MPKRTTDFRGDFLADLADPREASSYLNAALEDSEEMFLVALRDVADGALPRCGLDLERESH